MAKILQTAMNLLPICFILSVVFPGASASHRVYDLTFLNSLAAASKANGTDGVPAPYDVYRTGFHFQPVSHWMNDPNAPMFYKGFYHLFYQYNPSSAVWGMIRWGHAVSKDLINWRHLAKTALFADQWYDINGAWSGSATFLKNGTEEPVILYTGNTNESVQVTLMAYPFSPSDPLLEHWYKAPQNPIMVPNPSEINVSSFRDPTTAWINGRDKQWRLLIGNKQFNHNSVGMALLYKSEDFVDWQKVDHPLHSAPTTGMWECPDFYPVDIRSAKGLDASEYGRHVKHVLKNSLDDTKVDYYTLGKYNPKKDIYVPANGSVEGPDGLRYDYGKFYASKTFFDHNTGRRILWGWINESDSVADDVARGWAGVQAIPRVVSLDHSTKRGLILWPVEEVESLRSNQTSLSDIVLKPGSEQQVSKGFPKGVAQADVEANFHVEGDIESVFLQTDNVRTKTAQVLCAEVSRNSSDGDLTEGGFGLMVLASDDLKERSSVMFKFFADKNDPSVRKAALCVDQSKSTLKTNADMKSYGGFVNILDFRRNSFSLRVLVDRSIVESFAERGKTCITSRSYPTKAVGDDAHLFVFNHHPLASVRVQNLSVWRMKSAETVYEALV